MSEDNPDTIDFSGTPFDSGKIRNPDRIPHICEALEQHWTDAPDMRLGQLVSILTGPDDTFAVEDTEIMDELDVEFEDAFWVPRGNANE